MFEPGRALPKLIGAAARGRLQRKLKARPATIRPDL